MTQKKTLAIFLICFSLLMMTLAGTITTSVSMDHISYAQIIPFFPGQSEQPTPTSSPTATPKPTATATTLPPDTVTITSPQDGQQVPVGQDLKVTGTSNPKAAPNCNITVNLNRIRPYQPVVANGPGGGIDYSQWSFTITSNYAPIQEGQNRISARIACGSDPNLRQFAHVNVTGVAQ